MDTVKIFSDELEALANASGDLLKDTFSSIEEHTFSDHVAMLELRTLFLYRRVVSILEKMQELSVSQKNSDQMKNEKEKEYTSTKDLPLTILAQQIILAEQQKNTLHQLSESLAEMRKAKSLVPKTEQLLLLRQLKDDLENFKNNTEPERE